MHVHITHVTNDTGAPTAVGRAHLLDDIIENLTYMPDYYKRATLTFTLKVKSPLYNILINPSERSE